MFNSQYYKIWRDITYNKGRSSLVILSIVLGVFAIGLTLGARTILLREMTAAYHRSTPPDLIVGTQTLFDESLSNSLVRDPEIAAAYGRRTVNMRVQTGVESWQTIEMIVLEDTADMRVGQVELESGEWPARAGEILIERHGMGLVAAQIGDTLLIESHDGTRREATITGTTYDVAQFASGLSGVVYGYVAPETLAGFGTVAPHLSDELYISLARDKTDGEHVEAMLTHVESLVDDSRVGLAYIFPPGNPGEHGAQEVVSAIGVLLVTLGILTLVLATFLITNTMAALMSRQIRQIGVMKTVGASPLQLVGMFMLIPMAYGILALMIALPLGFFGGRFLATYVLGIVNFNAADLSFPTWLWVLQIVLGLLVPLVAALVPVMMTSRTSVREAVDNMVIKSTNSDGLFSRIFLTVTDQWLNLSRPMIISLQNTFRRKGRLAFTLVALTLGSAIYMAVSTLQLSTDRTLTEAIAFSNHDIVVRLEQPERLTVLQQRLSHVSALEHMEGWQTGGTRIVFEEAGRDSPFIALNAIPVGSEMVIPRLHAGEWLNNPSENQIVVNTDVIDAEPTLKIGDEITLSIQGKEERWTIIGIAKTQLNGRTIYMPFEQYAFKYGRPDRASQLVITGADGVSQTELSQIIDRELGRLGIATVGIDTVESGQDDMRFQFGIVTMLLTVMSVLITAVGSFGLVGTMGMNVMERIREIGVMRSIGADTQAILRIVIIEGLVIGLLGWFLGVFLSYPIGRLLSQEIGNIMMNSPLTHTFSLRGVALWLLIVATLSSLASLMPALNAARQEVRETLAHV